jgi:serine/threonine protein kinase
MSDAINQRIGDYEILGQLGEGGMGRVYRVRNVLTDRVEAMKVLLPDLAGRQELAARFEREIKVLASLNHPNIAGLRTAVVVDNQLLMIMEYVEGTTLAGRLEQGPISVADAVHYIDAVLSALGYAHAHHIIHRDIKPANMMLTSQGVIKLMDFGIARSGDEPSLTMTGTTLGSLNYMSPEQVTGQEIDARADLYSVGVSLYELVTGRRPFQADSNYSLMTAHVRDTPKPPVEINPSLPATLNEIILISIAKDPAQRFQTADAFRNALSSVSSAMPQGTTPAFPIPTLASTGGTGRFADLPAVTAAEATVIAPPSVVSSSTPSSTPSIPIPPPARSGGYRGFYMTAGALIVLAVLLIVGIYRPRNHKTQAGTLTPQPVMPDVQNDVTPAPSPALAPDPTTTTPVPPTATNLPGPANSAPGTIPAGAANTSPSRGKGEPHVANPGANSSTRAKAATKPKISARNNAGAGSSSLNSNEHDSQPSTHQTETASQPSVSAQADSAAAAELDQMEQEIDHLSSRVTAVNSGLDHLQEQQNSAGYGLRGDMVARQASMKSNLSKAQDAAERGDAARARKFLNMAQTDVEALEHFLGH